jgi:hypothetical protein
MTASSEPQFSLEQHTSRGATIMSLAVLIPAACSIILPLGVAAAHASTVALAAQEQPLAAVQVAAGIAVWTALFLVPAARSLKRLGLNRTVTIAHGQVTETVATLLGQHRTSNNLSAFAGIVHRVRTSVSGMQHELALVERGSGREVVFQVAPKLDREAVDTALRTLGLPELRAMDHQRLPVSKDYINLSAAHSAA